MFDKSKEVEIRQFSTRYGLEGPAQRPRIFDEVKCVYKSKQTPCAVTVAFHCGLTDYIDVNGYQTKLDNAEQGIMLFTQLTGVSPVLIEDTMRKIRGTHCPHCKSKKVLYAKVDSKPLEICCKCGMILHEFDIVRGDQYV